MSSIAPGHIDPVVFNKPIEMHSKVATMGSCFAQHIARYIKKSGFNYYITEAPPDDISDAEASKRNYGVFTARYGNIYSVKQALQLFDRAYGFFVPEDDIWENGQFLVDAFRPTIEPNGFQSKDDLILSREKLFHSARIMFENCDFFIFTLGLTESWRSKVDGAIYPVAPGVSGGVYDSFKYEFVNYSSREIVTDLENFICKIRTINPTVHIILTVSPVPLIATSENRHVLVSTVVSKAKLRVAADEMENSHPFVTYFPSYEIITSPANLGRYYADNLREVTALGINHVMRVFKKHYLSLNLSNDQKEALITEPIHDRNSVICDEELIENAVLLSGINSKKV